MIFKRSTKSKFIIFGQGRSGSTLLMELLDSHPEIKCDSELFTKECGYERNRFKLALYRYYPYPLINNICA